jgi:tetratricopeptide (TPR) repeat protein
VAVLNQALSIYSDLGNRVGQANALLYLGGTQRLSGDHDAAADSLGQALDIYRDIEDRGAENQALNEIGALHLARDDHREATACHQQALVLARKIASPWDEAHALAGLGRCARATGRIADARENLLQAQQIFQRIGAAETGDVTAELHALPSS